MAADVSVTHRPPLSPEVEAEAETPETVDRRAPEQELPPLDPEEIRKRLEHTERQFRNRRKILIRGLPGDVTNQVWGVGVRAWREIPRCACAAGGDGNRAVPTLLCVGTLLSVTSPRVVRHLRTKWKGHSQEEEKTHFEVRADVAGVTIGLGRGQMVEGCR